MIFVESPSNPGLKIFDLNKIGQFAKKHKLVYAVDNTFATPFLQRPIEFGADLVIHSATKYLDGQGRAVGGIVLGSKELIEPIFHRICLELFSYHRMRHNDLYYCSLQAIRLTAELSAYVSFLWMYTV